MQSSRSFLLAAALAAASLGPCLLGQTRQDQAASLKAQIAAVEKEIQEDKIRVDELAALAEKINKGEGRIPAAKKAKALEESEWARKLLEFARQRLLAAKADANMTRAETELKGAIVQADQARHWARSAEGALAPKPAIPEVPAVSRSTLTFSSPAFEQAVELDANLRDWDKSPPLCAPSDPVGYDPQKKVLTTGSGQKIPIGPLADAVADVVPGARGEKLFVSVPSPDGGTVLRLNPAVAAKQASPEGERELQKVGGVALDVTLDLLSYAGVAEFRQRGPATVVESPVLVSLSGLWERVRPFAGSPEDWRDLPEALRFPASVQRVHGIVLDPKNRDVFLVASPAQVPENRMDIDALIVGLRSAWSQGTIPRVSLDPLPDRPAGPQYSRVSGVLLQTTFARIMLDADYAMKRILFGDLDVGIPGFRDIDQASVRANAPLTSSRFWLSPVPLGDRDVRLSPSYRTILFESRVRCLNEVQNAAGEYRGEEDPWQARKARLFTETFESIERSPASKPTGVFVRLHGLVDLVTAGKILRDLGVDYPVLRRISDLPLRPLEGKDAVPPYYQGLSVVFARKPSSGGRTDVFTYNGGALLRARIARRSLDLYRDIATATLEHEADAFPRVRIFAKPLSLRLSLRKARSDERDGTELALLAGQASLRSGQYEAARARFAEVAAADPSYADAWAWLAESFSLAGRPTEAENAVRQAVELEPRDSLLQGMASRILWRAGKKFDRLKLNDESARFLSGESVNQAYELLTRGRRGEAGKEIAFALAAWPANPDAFLVRSLISRDDTSDEAMRDRDEAIRLYDQQMKSEADRADSFRPRAALANLLAAAARAKKFQSDTLRALAGISSYQAAWKTNSAIMDRLLLDLYNCVTLAKQARALDDLDGVAPAFYARLLASMMTVLAAADKPVDRGLGEAAEISKDVVRRFPNLPDGHFTRAWVAAQEIAVATQEMKRPGLYSQEETAALQRALAGLASEMFERLDAAVRLDPTYGDAFLFRALMHSSFGQKEKALADLEKAKTLLPLVDSGMERLIIQNTQRNVR